MSKKGKLLQLQEVCYMIRAVQEIQRNNHHKLEKPKVKMLKLVLPGFEGYFD